MREYRGKRIDNGEWVFGYLIKGNVDNDFYIKENLGEDAYWIDENTVGQFTGLTDKNGKKIFEGDIIKYEYTSLDIKSFDEYLEVFYDDETASYKCGYQDLWLISGEVVGNIHDNPELLTD